MKPDDRPARSKSPRQPTRESTQRLSSHSKRDGSADRRLVDRRRSAWAGAALVGLALLAYSPIVQAGWAGFDDNRWIVDNQALRSWDGLRQIWFVPSASQQYYPLTVTTHWIERHLWGDHPLGYHLVSVLLHATSAVLAWRVLLRLGLPGAWLAAAIFAVHPVCVESVAWVSERKNVLSLALGLASLLCYLRFQPLDTDDGDAAASPDADPRRWKFYALSLAFFIAALASKTVVVTLPAVLMVLLWWRRRLSWRTALPLLPMFGLSLLFGAATAWLEATQVGAVGADYEYTLVERVLIAGRAVWFYAGKDIWPYPLVFFYPFWNVNPRDWAPYLYPLGAALVVAGLWLARKKIGRGPLTATLIFIGILAPALGLVNLYYMQFSFVADHLQYHALLSLIALFTVGLMLLHRGDRTTTNANVASAGGIRVTGALILCALTALTMQRTTVYRNAETLYRDTLAGNPDNWQARINLSSELYKSDRDGEAAQMLREAAALRPNDANLLNNVGALLLSNDLPVPDARFAEAIGYLDAAALLTPDAIDPPLNLGTAWLQRGDAARALPYFQRALQIAPRNLKVHYGLGMALGLQGDWAAAASQFEKSLQIDPDYARGHYALGLANMKLKQREEAFKHLQRAIQLAPAMGDAKKAIEALESDQPESGGNK